MSMDRYEWSPAESSVPDKMVEVISGAYTAVDGSRIPIADHQIINSKWGVSDSEYIFGDGSNGMPKKLEVTWYAYAEDTFYRINEKLPALSDHFTQGLYDRSTASFEPIDRICLGFAPGGHVNLWLQNVEQSILIKSFKGTPESLDWESVMDVGPTKEEFIAEMLRENAKRHVESYTEQEILSFNERNEMELDLVVKGDPKSVDIRFFNGEKRRFALADGKCTIEDASLAQRIEFTAFLKEEPLHVTFDFNYIESLEIGSICSQGYIMRLYFNIFSNDIQADIHCSDEVHEMTQIVTSIYHE